MNGIDDGCEEEKLACPCWDEFTKSQLVVQVDRWYKSDGTDVDKDSVVCEADSVEATVDWKRVDGKETELSVSTEPSLCVFERLRTRTQTTDLFEEEYKICLSAVARHQQRSRVRIM